MEYQTRLETLQEFQQRTCGFTSSSLPSGSMETNPGLSKKVDREGKFLEYQGNTVVFNLPWKVKEKILALQGELYRLCGEVLAERIEAATFHITLHDLVSGPPSAGLEQEIKRTEHAAVRAVNELSGDKGGIRMRSTFLFNMVNTSMVLGFEPGDQESCLKLMGYYEIFQRIVPLDYPLTPHVTVAYFRPGRISEGQVCSLKKAVDFAKFQETLETKLTGEMLEYQVFSDMNHYWKTPGGPACL